jgi:hypothetical protein
LDPNERRLPAAFIQSLLIAAARVAPLSWIGPHVRGVGRRSPPPPKKRSNQVPSRFKDNQLVKTHDRPSPSRIAMTMLRYRLIYLITTISTIRWGASI